MNNLIYLIIGFAVILLAMCALSPIRLNRYIERTARYFRAAEKYGARPDVPVAGKAIKYLMLAIFLAALPTLVLVCCDRYAGPLPFPVTDALLAYGCALVIYALNALALFIFSNVYMRYALKTAVII